MMIRSSLIAAGLLALSTTAHADAYETNTEEIRVNAAAVHAQIPPRVLFTSTGASYRIEARFSFGTRIPTVENILENFDLTSIESGEAYEVRIFLVDTSTSGGTTGGGGMTIPGPGPTPGSACSAGPDLPWSFGRGRTDFANADSTPVLGPWTGWIPAPQLFDMVVQLVPCQPMRRDQIRADLAMNRTAVISGFQAFMADPHEHDFDPAFEAVTLAKAKQTTGQWINSVADEVDMMARDAGEEAEQMEAEIDLLEEEQENVPCEAPPNQVAADRCKALEERVAFLEKEAAERRAREQEGIDKANEARQHGRQMEAIQIWQAYLTQTCGAGIDIMRSILQYKLSKPPAGTPSSFMWWTIQSDATVQGACIMLMLRNYAMNPSPLSSALVDASMIRAGVLFGIDSVLLFLEMQAAKKPCSLDPEPATQSSCRWAVSMSYWNAWRRSGAILTAAILTARIYQKNIQPNLPFNNNGPPAA